MKLPRTATGLIHPEVHLLVLLTLFFLFTSVFMPQGGHLFDQALWADWIVYMQQHGIRHVYDLYAYPEPGQSPVFI